MKKIEKMLAPKKIVGKKNISFILASVSIYCARKASICLRESKCTKPNRGQYSFESNCQSIFFL